MSHDKRSALRVLIVDDEPDLRELLSEEFAMGGYSVSCAGTVQSAKDILATEEIHLVISDMRMPGMGGLDLLKWIQALPNRPSVIFMSGYTELSEKEFIQLGASALFLKPFALNDVLTKASLIMESKMRGVA
jgi:DNA-binding response OmpR family regulator